jgi:hypothetical protein
MDGDEEFSRRIDAAVEAFESAWSRDGQAELVDFLLPRKHPHYLAVRCDPVRVDLEYGWQRRKPRSLEDYRRLYPELVQDHRLAKEVFYEDLLLRRQAGEPLDPADYQDLFEPPA